MHLHEKTKIFKNFEEMRGNNEKSNKSSSQKTALHLLWSQKNQSFFMKTFDSFLKKILRILAKLTKYDAMNWDFKTFNSLTKLSLICRVVAQWDMMHNANFFSGKIYSQNRHKHVSTSSLALLSRWSQKIYNCLAPPSIERNNIP